MDHEAKVRETVLYIEDHLDCRIGLADLAKRAHLSKYHYHRLFHKIAGDSVIRYVSRRRMEKAAEELAGTDAAILDIALKYQYGSQESFSRAFKRIYGITPGQFRRISAKREPCRKASLSVSFGRQIMDMAA